MVTPTLAVGQFVTALLVVLFLAISVVMILVVLIQRPQGGGLSGAFGGSSAGSSQTAFGARTGDALTIITIGIFVAFLGLAIGLNFIVGPPSAQLPTATGAANTPAGTPATTGTQTDTTTAPANGAIDATTDVAGPSAPVEGVEGGETELPVEIPTEGGEGEQADPPPPAEAESTPEEGEGEGGQ